MDIILRSLLRDLVSAVEQNDREQIELLLSDGLQADVPDRFGVRTAFLAAVKAGNLEIVRWLIRDVHHPDLSDNNNTPLSYVIHQLGEAPSPVIRQHWLEMMECLLEAGADPTAGDRDGKPIVLSRLYGMKDIEAILEQCIEVRRLGRATAKPN
ncbi:MAG: ankyrin repeat domain-containing protein [Chamaesiphon sp.]|nr:ankyrin repeat domain-containing protein [Chamaesiphon sp.]